MLDHALICLCWNMLGVERICRGEWRERRTGARARARARACARARAGGGGGEGGGRVEGEEGEEWDEACICLCCYMLASIEVFTAIWHFGRKKVPRANTRLW